MTPGELFLGVGIGIVLLLVVLRTRKKWRRDDAIDGWRDARPYHRRPSDRAR